jgi:hypothetical protein
VRKHALCGCRCGGGLRSHSVSGLSSGRSQYKRKRRVRFMRTRR